MSKETEQARKQMDKAVRYARHDGHWWEDGVRDATDALIAAAQAPLLAALREILELDDDPPIESKCYEQEMAAIARRVLAEHGKEESK